MTDWPTILEAETDPGAPLTSNLVKSLRDQPVAIAEGADDAPRIVLKSLERLTAGAEVRSSRTTVVAAGGTDVFVIQTVGFMQIGQVRAVVTRISGGSVSLDRVRAGVTTNIVASALADISADVDVLPGDALVFRAIQDASNSRSYTCKIQTNGESLWPAPAIELVGNDV